jgi:hypothetical protein
MAGLKDNFELLKRTIIGTKTTNIDAKLDQAVTDITNFKSQSGRNGYIDLVRNLISKSTGSFNIDSSSKGMFGQGSTSPAMFGQQKRMQRYKTYAGTISTIDYCYRALDVLTDNICSPDDITKTTLEIKPKKFLEDETPTESKTVQVKGLVHKLKIEEHLPLIVRNTLLFGDFFCEIASPKTALTSSSYLAEQQHLFESGVIEEFAVPIKGKDDWKIRMNYEGFVELGTEVLIEAGETDKTDGKKDASDVVLLFHDPSRIVKLQSELYPICFGYLVFPKANVVPHLSMQDQAVNDICNSILKNLSKKVPQIAEFNGKELKDIVASMVASGQDQSKATSIRYVSPDRIQHFMRPSTKYEPYGESIFDACQFTAKCLVAMETALAVQRLAKSTEKRKIAVEIGLPRDARKMIEKLKEELRKRKVTLDNFGTVDTIPSMITTFEDVYIPQKDGKPFVDISTFNEGNVDIRSKVDELKFLRDSVVASLGVPPSFINIEENLSNKAALTEENILFARTIVSHQKYITHQMNKLIQKVYDIISPEEALSILDNVLIALPSPKSLQYEREARYLSELANLIETLERVGIPREYTKKKYLSNIDWEDLKNYEVGEKIEKELGTEKEDDPMAGGMAGMGGGY